MAKKSSWIEQNLLEVIGMATNPFNPGRKYAERIKNAYVHETPGALTLRDGYSLRYSAPSRSTLTNGSFLNFDMFYDRAAKVAGQEVLCLIQKAALVGLDDGAGSPIVADTMNGFWFWCVPHWNLTKWEDSYQWVNESVITKIVVGSDATYPNMVKIFGGQINHNFTDNYFDRWVIYNKTKDQFAQVLVSKNEGNNTRINHTLYNSTWAANDVIILSKYWIKIADQTTLYNDVTAQDIAFHNINNDLRIGFGGKANRPGIAIGYRHVFNQIQSVDFPNIHPDITDAQIEDFAEINELMLDAHILDKNAYGMELSVAGDGGLTAAVYSFRLTGRMDLYTEQLLAEGYIAAEADSKITIDPYAYLGQYNPRITSFVLYYSTNNSPTFYKIQEFTVKGDAFNKIDWRIDQFSKLRPLAGAVEFHSESNAASIDNESNSVGSWTVHEAGTLSVDTVAAGTGSYSLKFFDYTPGVYESIDLSGMKFPVSGIVKGKYYDISLQLKAIIPYKKINVFFAGASGSTIGRTVEFAEALESDFSVHEIELLADDIDEDITHFVISVAPEHGNDLYLFSDVRYVSQDDGTTFTEISSGSGSMPAPIVLGDRMLSYIISNLIASFDHGISWNTFGSAFLNSIVMLDRIGERLYLGLNDGALYLSEDRGASWAPLTTDVSGGSNHSLRGVAEDASYLYCATVGGGVYRSNDDGATWSAANTGLTDTDIYAIYADSNYVVVVANDGTMDIWSSSDNADNWSSVNTPTGDGTSKLIHDGTYLYVATLGITTPALWRTGDYGVTAWTNLTSAAGISEDRGFYDPFLRNGIIWFGSLDTTDGGKLWKTDDAGATIVEVTAGAVSSQDAPALVGDNNTFWADEISIAQKNLSVFQDLTGVSTEMKTEMGYVPDADLVKGWDQAIFLRGRTYYLNPYVDKRYENFLLVSHIHSDGAYMWDIASFSNYRELERYDSSNAIGMTILPTTEIMIFKNKSAEILSDDGLVGILREPIVGVSCVSRRTIVNLAGLIVWCGDDDIYTFSVSRGLNAVLVDTIRDLYQAIEERSQLFATRDRYNSYRLRINDATNKTEFLFFNNFNVVEEAKFHLPEIYREDFDARLNFLNEGDIYGIRRPLDGIGYGKLYASTYGEVL